MSQTTITKPTILHITCTGIDDATDLDALVRLQKQYPLAEFGILFSEKVQKSPRYAGLPFIHSLHGKDLNLSLHLCGRLAREAVSGNWAPTQKLLGEDLALFSRIQLNVAGYAADRLPERPGVTVPKDIKEVVIQQKDANHCGLFLAAAKKSRRLSVLLDASGGRGVRGEVKALDKHVKTGFAGGLDAKAIETVIPELYYSGRVGAFWVDAESRLRDADDRFDVRKAENFLMTTTAICKFWLL